MLLQFTDPGAYFAGYIVFIVVVLAINIGISVWVYRDANKNGMDATIWLLVESKRPRLAQIQYFIISRDVF